jgi:hypothetical protein
MPRNALASDIFYSQAKDKLREETTDRFYLSPVLQQMAGGRFGALKEKGGALTTTGSVLSALYNNTVGQMIEDPFMSRARVQNQMRDMFSGTFFGRRGGGGGFGLSEGQLQSQTQNLFNMGQGRQQSIFKQGAFSAPEMFEIAALGSERGLFEGANAQDISRRTEGLAKVIKTGQAVFKTMDKEGVLEAIQEITQGQVPLSNTGELNRAMFKIAAMARSANASIEVMSRLSAEGAALFRQVGIGGTTGAMAHTASARATQLMTGSMMGPQGGNLGQVVNSQTVARAGGRRAVTALFQQQDIGLLGSGAFQENAFLMQEMNRLGAGTGAQRAEFERLFSRGELTEANRVQMTQAVAKAQGVGFGTIRSSMVMSRGLAAEDFINRQGSFEATRRAQRAHFRQTIQPLLGDDQALFEGAALADESKNRLRVDTLAHAISVSPEGQGKSPAQLKAMAQRMMLTVGEIASESKNPKARNSRVAQRYRAYQARSLEDIQRRETLALGMEAMEEQRPQGRGFLQRFVEELGDDDLTFSSAGHAFMKALQGDDQATQDLVEKFIRSPGAGDKATLAMITKGISKEQYRASLGGTLNEILFQGADMGREKHAILSQVLGKRGFSAKGAEKGITRGLDIMKKAGSAKLSQKMLANKDAILTFADEKGISVQTLSEMSKQFGGTEAGIFRLLEDERGAATDVFRRRIESSESFVLSKSRRKGEKEAQSDLQRLVGGEGASPEVQRAMMKVLDDKELKEPERELLSKHFKDRGEFPDFEAWKTARGADLQVLRKRREKRKDWQVKIMGAKTDSPLFAARLSKEVSTVLKKGKVGEDFEELFGGKFEDIVSPEERKDLAEALEKGGAQALLKKFTATTGRVLGKEESALVLAQTFKETSKKFQGQGIGAVRATEDPASKTLKELERLQKEGLGPFKTMAKKAEEANQHLKDIKDNTAHLKPKGQRPPPAPKSTTVGKRPGPGAERHVEEKPIYD